MLAKRLKINLDFPYIPAVVTRRVLRDKAEITRAGTGLLGPLTNAS